MSYETRYVQDTECDWCYRTILKIIVDGKVKKKYYDGGEPEDNSFDRDWNWVAFELVNAYNKGLEDGKASQD